MSAEPKRVELTPQERDRLFAALHWTGSGRPISPMTASGASSVIRRVLPAIAELVAAREAAARREALLEAKRALLAQAATISDEPVTAFGVADLYQMGRKDGYRFGAGVVTHLAEPERDEEGGND